MTEDAALQLALTHYRITLPGADWAAVAGAWQTEYAAVSTGAFRATLITAGSFEGGNAAAIRGFEQSIRLRALQLRRGELDADFAPALLPQQPTVMYPIFSNAAFNH